MPEHARAGRSKAVGRRSAADWAPLPIDFEAIFVETPLVRRLVSWLDRTREERVWRLVGATARAGKTKACVYYAEVLHPPQRATDGTTSRPAVTVIVPRGQRYSAARLRERMAWHIGAVVSRRAQTDATWIAGELARCETELLIVSDANRMPSEDHLPVIQEIADLFETLSGRRLAVALISATERGSSLLRLSIEHGDFAEWSQIRGRFAGEHPFVVLPGMSLDDVRDVLHAYDGELAGGFPQLRLVRWASDIHEFVKLPALAPDGVGQVRMQSVARFVEAILRRLTARGMPDIDPAGDLVQEVGRALIAVPQGDSEGEVRYADAVDGKWTR